MYGLFEYIFVSNNCPLTFLIFLNEISLYPYNDEKHKLNHVIVRYNEIDDTQVAMYNYYFFFKLTYFLSYN